MAKILRSTFRYPTTEAELIKKTPAGETQLVNFRVFISKFNQVYDPVLGVIRPPRSLDEETALGIRTTVSYSSNDYFIGLAVNDIVIHDGIFKIIDGIEVNFINRTTSTVTQGSSGTAQAGVIGNGQEGQALIDTRKINFGILDDIKIVVIKANTYSPWLYFGSIPERAKLVYNDNRQIASSGAIYPLEDTEIIQAVGFRYFIDMNLDTLNVPVLIPFVSAFFTPTFGVSAAVGTGFFVADAVDGDGNIGYRTSTNFKMLSIGLNEGVGFFSADIPIAQAIRADSFRTVNYKQLEYNKNTYKINKFIIDSDFYILPDPEKEIVEYINLVGSSFDIVENFIDFDTTRMSFDAGDIISDSDFIKQQFINYITVDNFAIGGRITTLQSVISNNITSKPSTNSIYAIVMSDLITEVDDPNAAKQLKDAVAGFTSKLTNVIIKLQLFITDSSKSTQTIALANEVFGSSNVIKVDASDALNLGWLNFVGLLAESSGTNFDENSLVTKQLSVDVNSLKDGLSIATSPSGSSGIDYDKDGIVSIIDSRLYELTTRYKPTQSFSSLETFLSDPGAEMRFWRKIIPTGNLFSFVGKIIKSESVVGGNLLMDVDITWPQIEDPENPPNLIDDPNKPGTNIIKVLVEYGAKTNLESIDPAKDVVFQGRLFHPGYLIKTRINNIIKFGTTSDLSEISSWFRVFLTTARTILAFGRGELPDVKDFENEPLLIIRSNMAPTGSLSSNTTPAGLSPIFGPGGSGSAPESRYRIIEGSEEVDDYLNLLNDDRNLTTEASIDFNEKLPIFSPGSDVILNSIEFEILVPKDSKPPASDNQNNDGLIANFEYEILYQPTGFLTDDSTLTKFFSVVVFNGEIVDDKLVYKIKYNPQNNQKFTCQPTKQDIDLPDTIPGGNNAAIPNPDKNREFNITFPYGQKNDGTDFIWTWTASDWEFSIRKNDKALSDSSFETKPDPATGKFKLKTAINPQEEILVAEFVNISGNQRKLKKGSKVSIRLKSGPQNIEKPTFRNARTNFETFNKAERVEAHYSSTAQGDSYYLIAPAFGFASLSGAGWTFNQEPGTETAGGSFSTRIIGNINGPILFIDAFSDNTADKTISKVGGIPYSFPYIDVVHSNLVNTFGKPFLETLSILFEPPPPPDVERIASVRSKISDRLTIVYNSNDIIKQKYSFTNFDDRNTNVGWEDFVEESLRKTVPIYSEFVTLVDKEFESGGDGSIIFNVTDTNASGAESGDKILVSIGIESAVPDEEILPISTVKVYELHASIDGTNYGPFGYSDATGNQTPLRLIYDKNRLKQLPDTRGISKIKIKPVNSGESVNISKLVGGYVGALNPGRSPSIFETAYGEYILFYVQPVSNSPLRQIKALFSNHDAQEWIRPGVPSFIEVAGENGQVNKQRNPELEEPIILLSGYNNPVVIKNNISDTFYLFVYNSRTIPGKIDMIEMERALFLKIKEDNTSEASDTAVETPDESQTSLTNTDEVVSYARVFKQVASGGFNHIKTVLTNASQNFSIVLTKNGDLYLAVITTDGQFRIKYNRSLGSGNINTSFNWEDLGINLFDTTTDNGDGTKGSLLGKVVNSSNIAAMTLSFSDIDDVLYLFLATNSDKKLISVRLPESIVRPKGLKTVNNDNENHIFLGEEKTDTQIDQYFQSEFNKIKPILVYGKKEGLNPEFIEIRSSTTDNFPPQIVYVEWLDNGDGHLYFVANTGRIQGRKTRTSGLFWENLNNI